MLIFADWLPQFFVFTGGLGLSLFSRALLLNELDYLITLTSADLAPGKAPRLDSAVGFCSFVSLNSVLG